MIVVFYCKKYIWGLNTLGKDLSVAARIMQSSSKELSTLVADRVLKCKQMDVCYIDTLKFPLANVVRLLAEWSET